MNPAPNASSKVLFFCHAISHAHVVRALGLTRFLTRNYVLDLVVAAPASVEGMFRSEGVCVEIVKGPDKPGIYERLVAGGSMFTAEDLRHELAEDEALVEKHRPTLIISEFRFSAQELARRRGLPCVCITEAPCLPGYSPLGPFPDSVARTLPLPLRMLDWIGSSPLLFPAMLRATGKKLGQPMREAFGQQTSGRDFFTYATQADLCLVSDLPELVPATLRPQDVYCGPLYYDRDDPLPAPPADWPRTGKTIYVSIGTQKSFDPRSIDSALGRLLAEGVRVVYSLGGRAVEPPPPRPGLWVVAFVNDAKLMPTVDLVIYPSGAMTTYEALRAGVPLLALPAHANQHFYAWRVKQSGAGDWLRPSEFSADRLVERVHALLASDAPKQKAREFAARIARFDRDSVLHARLAPLLPAGTARRA